MLEVNGIANGIVLDHMKAGLGLVVFNKLVDGKIDHPVVLLMNVSSQAMGKKDIIKIENTFDVDLNILGLIDENITVNIIKDGKLFEKQEVVIPKKLKGYIKCKNPRCISHFDNYVEPEFTLYSKDSLEYLCSFCDEITKYE
ncbi:MULTISPECIES: aspartate carbamoyltransferase regulatory subunit [unclassified Fusibacter]|uniref:aspartate carbamoyltransferase regulatory subunit n=1 Tax=unclassified Fusibacter TaxID=2624464 RepID=UPI001012E745|nr:MULTISPECIES: aspartate carbamoyltransferase regulatory subunit [unclassified Fusibacter]MCK8061559.1 aspartate carbamoyltransferase regulatory subunit [Fusibacter sp. A2]NPE23713.1 aspartate carbamoyltransferase regulatory subunit [Fusibacter sp. A1]RXV58740.1 aspartate carbamoyltransferase regulatory subunit [Fusibacter sp. A1]